jgi:hypothetical protein
MGMPSINIIFAEKAKEVSGRSERGIVGMIVKDSNVPDKNPITIYKAKDIPSEMSAENKEQIALAMVGNVKAPRRVDVYVLPQDAEGYEAALAYFAMHKVNYLCAPTASTDNQATAVTTWVKEQREKKNKVKAVLPNTAADSEGIIDYATDKVILNDGKEYTAEQFCSRIAGLLAGTPIQQACTFSVLPDVADSSDSDREDIGIKIDAGKLLVFNDGEKVKVAGGVNSLTKVPEGKSETWKKIKVVETMDMIYDDLVKLIEDNYIGKMSNSYDNKCLVLSAVIGYFGELVGDVLSSANASFDIDAIREYLESKGINTNEMTDDQIKKADTGDKLFLAAEISILDALEEITLKIMV